MFQWIERKKKILGPLKNRRQKTFTILQRGDFKSLNYIKDSAYPFEFFSYFFIGILQP